MSIATTGTRLCTALFILLFCSTAFGGSTKVEICHVPPDNPENFHTIRINTKALPAHLSHGDLGEPCNTVCTALCDDGNACTIDDDIFDCEENGCPIDRNPVDCNDGNECTADSCDPTNGCENTPRLGEACDDGALCTGSDTCDANGQCSGPAIDLCCLGNEDCSGNACDQAECNLDSNRCGNNPVVCSQPDMCTVSECGPDTGECVESPIVCDDGFECNLDNGECEPENACPCFSEAILQGLGTVIPGQCGDNYPFTGIAAAFYTNTSVACSGSGGCGTVNPSCGYDDVDNGISVGSGIDPLSEEQDTACRLLIASVCPQASNTQGGEENSPPQHSLPILSNQ